MLSLNVFRSARTRSPFSHIRLSTRPVHERELVCGWILLGAANTALTRRSAAGGESVPGPAKAFSAIRRAPRGRPRSDLRLVHDPATGRHTGRRRPPPSSPRSDPPTAGRFRKSPPGPRNRHSPAPQRAPPGLPPEQPAPQPATRQKAAPAFPSNPGRLPATTGHVTIDTSRHPCQVASMEWLLQLACLGAGSRRR